MLTLSCNAWQEVQLAQRISLELLIMVAPQAAIEARNNNLELQTRNSSKLLTSLDRASSALSPIMFTSAIDADILDSRTPFCALPRQTAS